MVFLSNPDLLKLPLLAKHFIGRMTVNYTAEVANVRFGGLMLLLARWKGSIYKLLWKDFLAYIVIYYAINLPYRFAMNDSQKRHFEGVAQYCAEYGELIPIAFLLGFYLNFVMERWWRVFLGVPWPDKGALLAQSLIRGNTERVRMFRRTIVRYMNLSFVIVFSSISPPVHRRFPTLNHMAEAGLMLPEEQKLLEEGEHNYNIYYVPISWATTIISQCRKEKYISDDFALQALIDELMDFRGMLGNLLLYDWICVPLVYTQVVTIAVHTYFIASLIGAQLVDADASTYDVYVPVFLFLQFLFYMGWLKVAEALLHPFGEDDDDFDINAFIDRNVKVAYLMVDVTQADIPKPSKDQHWDQKNVEIPYLVEKDQKHDQAEFDLGSALRRQKSISSIIPGDVAPTLEAKKSQATSVSKQTGAKKKSPLRKVFDRRRMKSISERTFTEADETETYAPSEFDAGESTGLATKSPTGLSKRPTFSGRRQLSEIEEIVENVNDFDWLDAVPSDNSLDLDDLISTYKKTPKNTGKTAQKANAKSGLGTAAEGAANKGTEAPAQKQEVNADGQIASTGSIPKQATGSGNLQKAATAPDVLSKKLGLSDDSPTAQNQAETQAKDVPNAQAKDSTEMSVSFNPVVSKEVYLKDSPIKDAESGSSKVSVAQLQSSDDVLVLPIPARPAPEDSPQFLTVPEHTYHTPSSTA